MAECRYALLKDSDYLTGVPAIVIVHLQCLQHVMRMPFALIVTAKAITEAALDRHSCISAGSG